MKLNRFIANNLSDKFCRVLEVNELGILIVHRLKLSSAAGIRMAMSLTARAFQTGILMYFHASFAIEFGFSFPRGD